MKKGLQGGHVLSFCPAFSREAQGRSHQGRRISPPQTIAEFKNQFTRSIPSRQQLLKSAIAQTIWHQQPAGVVVCDARGRVILVNRAARQMARIAPEGMFLSGAPFIWGKLQSESGVDAAGWPHLSDLLEKPIAERECRLVQSNATAYDVLFSTAPLTATKQTRAGAVLMFTDITPVKRRELKLRERAVSEERKRMAGELHDTLCQGLNAIVLMLQAAQASSAQNGEAAQPLVHRACAVAMDTLREARGSMWTFVQEPVENIDPAASLAAVTEQIFNDTPIEVALSLQKQPFSLPPRIRFDLLRIGKEALTNVLKHSQATRVHLELAYKKQTVQLSVRDDGRGFGRESSGNTSRGYGLTSMHQRAERLGGKVAVESQPRHGTSVVAVIPLNREAIAMTIAV
jgi:signal transduction histidine kinase